MELETELDRATVASTDQVESVITSKRLISTVGTMQLVIISKQISIRIIHPNLPGKDSANDKILYLLSGCISIFGSVFRILNSNKSLGVNQYAGL